MSAQRPSHSPPNKEQARPAAGPGPRPVGRNKNSKMSGRILSACDACRQSKVRCTGGNPCLTCQWYQRSCNYSPGGRLGRPKGSKNKRTLMQQILNLNKEQPSETQRDTNRSTADVMQWIGSGQHQRQQRQQQLPPPEPDLISFEFDMEHAFDTTIAFGEGESPAGDGSRDLMLDMGQDLSADDDSGLSHQACLAQTSRALVSGQQLPVSDSGPGQFRAFPSDGSTDPFGTIFPSSNPAPSGYSRASPPISPVSPPSAASNLPSNVRSGCLCLQRLVRLLYHLEELRFPQGHGHGHAARAHQAAGPSADSVLRGVQAAKMPWQGFIHCSVHGDDDGHREALLLFAMSIRILLLAVQKLNSTIRLSQTELSSDIAVSVGDFELMGEAKAEIIGVVIRRALWAITIALQHLWERAGQPTAQTGSELGSSSPPERSSPISILTGSSCKDPPQVRPRAFSAPASTTSFGAEDESVVSLLATLQCTMKTLEQETQASGAGSEPKPSPI